MKLVLTAAAAVATLALAAGSASAQYPAVVPHRGHYHVVPSYSPPVYGGYGYPAYSLGVTLGGVYPSLGVGGVYSSPGFGYGSGYYPRSVPYSTGFGWGGHHHHHGHHNYR